MTFLCVCVWRSGGAGDDVWPVPQLLHQRGERTERFLHHRSWTRSRVSYFSKLADFVHKLWTHDTYRLRCVNYHYIHFQWCFGTRVPLNLFNVTMQKHQFWVDPSFLNWFTRLKRLILVSLVVYKWESSVNQSVWEWETSSAAVVSSSHYKFTSVESFTGQYADGHIYNVSV